MPRLLDDWLQAYLEYTQFSESPNKFHFWTGVATIAGALRSKVYFEMGYFRWTPNFYIILVAPSGIAAKSTTGSLGMEFLAKLPDITFGPTAMTSQSFWPMFKDAKIDRFLPNGEVISEACLTFFASELGVLLDPEDKGMLDLLVHLWDGRDKELKKRTISRGMEAAEHPWVNILACTTPKWISTYMKEIFIGGGFTSRCVFVYANKKRKLVAYPSDALEENASDPNFAELQRKLVSDLTHISTLSGRYVLTPAAKAYGKQWYEYLYTEAIKDSRLAAFEGYVSRAQGHAHKIAMVLTAAKSSKPVIEKETLEAAVQLLKDNEETMHEVLQGVEAGPSGKYTDEILRCLSVQKDRRMAQAQIYRYFLLRYALQKDEFTSICNSMAEAGLVQIVQRGQTIFVEVV